MIDWHELPKFRVHQWLVPTCPWGDHDWVRLGYQYDYPDDRPSEMFAIAVLCRTCGRTPAEAMELLPITIPEAIYPDPVVKKR